MFQAEYDAFKRKIKLRANDLGSELVNEFLREERDDGKQSKFMILDKDQNELQTSGIRCRK